MRRFVNGVALAALLSVGMCLPAVGQKSSGLTVLIRKTDGTTHVEQSVSGEIALLSEGRNVKVPLRAVLSIHFAGSVTAPESARIAEDLAAVQGTNRAAREAAVEELTDIGLPVMSPLLALYKDTDLHEPSTLYRLFARIVPGSADNIDRKLDLVRLADGKILRGKVISETLALATDGAGAPLRLTEVRMLAVRRAKIEKTFDLQALRHCTYVEFLDSGVIVAPGSKLEETAEGFVRLSFDVDGWACDADGLKTPGPHYTSNLVDGFAFGAVVGRIGAAGKRWLAGRRVSKPVDEQGRLYFAVNDNPHWQNNLGSFRVKLRAFDAYDLGDPQ